MLMLTDKKRRDFLPPFLNFTKLDAILSVIDVEQSSLLVELHLEVVGQLYLEAVALFVNLDDGGIGIGSLHIVGDDCGNQMSRNGIELAVHFVPIAFLVKLQLDAVVQVYLKLSSSVVEIFLGKHDSLSREVLLDECHGCCGQLLSGDESVTGKCGN